MPYRDMISKYSKKCVWFGATVVVKELLNVKEKPSLIFRHSIAIKRQSNDKFVFIR